MYLWSCIMLIRTASKAHFASAIEFLFFEFSLLHYVLSPIYSFCNSFS